MDQFETESAVDQEFDATVSTYSLPLPQLEDQSAKLAARALKSRMKELHQLSLMLHQPEEDTPPSTDTRHRSTEPNQRQFYRCPLPEEQSVGILNLNGHRFHCRIVELSIGGFGVVLTGKPQFALGSIGSLRTPSLNYVVSITRQEDRDGATFIGLKQLEEVLDSNQRLPGEPSSVWGYLVACVSGALIATVSYYFMNSPAH